MDNIFEAVSTAKDPAFPIYTFRHISDAKIQELAE